MCIFKTTVAETAGAPPVAPRQDQDTGLPEARDTKDADKISSVQYGNSKKDRGSAEANRTGTDALKINLDENQGAGTGGINV